VKFDNYIDWMKSCWYISATGNPAASVPGGFTPEGLPVGVQIVGRDKQDFSVLQSRMHSNRRPASKRSARRSHDPKILRLLAGLAGVVFLVLGLIFLLAPGQLTDRFAVLATGSAGFGTLRADLGGLSSDRAIFPARRDPRIQPLSGRRGRVSRLHRSRPHVEPDSGRPIERSIQAALLELALATLLVLTLASLRRGHAKQPRLWIFDRRGYRGGRCFGNAFVFSGSWE